MSGTVSGTIDGLAIPSTTKSINFNIHVVGFSMSVPDLLYRVGASTVTQPFSLSYSPVHAEVPVFTYTNWVLEEDVGAGYAAQNYMGVSSDPVLSTVSVYETSNVNTGRYMMKLRTEPVGAISYPGYIIEDTFVVDVYDLVASATVT